MLVFVAGCGRAESPRSAVVHSPATPSAVRASAYDILPAHPGAVVPDALARCLQRSGEPSCFSGARADGGPPAGFSFAECLARVGGPACFETPRLVARSIANAAALGEPTGLSASVSGSTVTLTWTAVNDGDP